MNKQFLSILIALILSLTVLSACTAQQNDNSEQEEKIYAADTLLSENGTFGNDYDGTLCVGFIGGSLTDGESYTTEEGHAFGGQYWTNIVCNYLEEKFPNRKILPHNAGIGGTGSDYGAARITNTILDYAPDIVFIEYTVNDCGRDRENSQKYMEVMVRMTQKLEKVPVVIFVYTPNPVEKNSTEYITWEQGRNWKQEIADYYGIGSIDIYDYMQSVYAKTDYPTFLDFLLAESSYNGTPESGFDVHGGYEYYAASITNALDTRPTEIIKRQDIKDNWFENGIYKDSVYTKFNLIFPTSDRFVFDGDWKFFSYDKLIVEGKDYGIHVNYHDEYSGLTPQKHKHGVMTTMDTSASFSFTTNADAIYMSCLSGIAYYTPEFVLNAAVYVDGQYIKDFVYDSFVLLAELDGEEHNVTVKMTEPSSEVSYFLLAYITEGYKEPDIRKYP